MNIAASNAQGNAAPSRMDAATANDPLADGDPTAGADIAGFGQVLSDTVSREAAPRTRADAKDRTVDTIAGVAKGLLLADDETGIAAAPSDPPVPFDLTALLGGMIDASKGAGPDPATRAKSTDATKDVATDDVSAQLAMLAQWTGATPSIANATARVEGSAETAVATRGLPAIATLPRAAGTVPTQSRTVPSSVVVATSAAVEPARVPDAGPPAALDVAAFVAGRTARPVEAADADATVARTASSKPDNTTRIASPDSITAALDNVLSVAVAGPSSSVPDPGSMASQFVTQVAANVANAQGSLAVVAAPSSAALREHVATPAWSQELGQAAIRMATDDLQHASLRLNPEHLGPLDVQVRIDNGIAHMQFTAAHADTRAALEGSRATLDQMFGDQGLKVGDWSVGNSSTNASFARQFGTPTRGDGKEAPTGDSDGSEVVATVSTRAMRPVGLVDTFA